MTRYIGGLAIVTLALFLPSSAMASWITNGDFESTNGSIFVDWSNPAYLEVETGSIISGTTSAEVLVGGVPYQPTTDAESEWTFEMDFAAFMSGAQAMNFTIKHSASGQINIRMNGIANELYALSQGTGWVPLGLYVNATTDTGTSLVWDGETPEVNHIRIEGHYEADTPYYDLTLNGTTLTGLSYYQYWGSSTAPVTGDVPTRIDLATSGQSWLADNITIGAVPEPGVIALLATALVSLAWVRFSRSQS